MKILRANYSNTDIFAQQQLDSGACCFYSEDKAYKYFFEINGREAVLFTNTEQYISKVIDEFLFYSGFINLIKDEEGNVLHKRTIEPYLLEISKIQPSQFYINQQKLESCKKWIKSLKDIFIPIAIKDGKTISLDGHTRIKAAIDLGYTSVFVYPDEYDDTIFHFVDEAVRRNINSVYNMEVISGEEYKVKWDKFCDELFSRLDV